MNEKDKKHFSVMVGALCSAHGVEITEPRLLAFWIGLKDLDLMILSDAIDTAIKTIDRMPSPAQIRNIVVGDDSDAAELAWLELGRAIDQHGSYRTVRFTDGVLAVTVESLGGWRQICGMNTTEFESFFRHRFLETYKSFRARGVTSEKPCIGIIDQHNQRISKPGTKHIGSLVNEVAGVTQKRIS